MAETSQPTSGAELELLVQLFSQRENMQNSNEDSFNEIFHGMQQQSIHENAMDVDGEHSSQNNENGEIRKSTRIKRILVKSEPTWDEEVSVMATADNSFACGICGELLTEKDSLSDHMKEHENEERNAFKCETCSLTLSSEILLEEHLQTHEKEKTFKCLFCEKIFGKKATWVQHMCAHAAQVQISCNLCLQSFSCVSDLQNHKKTHLKEKLIQCEVCNEVFKRKTHLAKHIRLHHNKKKSFLCLLCNKTFSKKVEFTVHMKTHGNKKSSVKWKHEKALRLEDVIKNVRFQKNEKTHNCRYCKQKFERKTDKSKHEKLHTEHMPYHCELCNKSFRRKNYLQRHNAVHEKRQQFKCDLSRLAPSFQFPVPERSFKSRTCDREFCLKEDTIQRVQAELKVKPFQCEMCQRTFTRKSDLNRHEKTHTSVRLFRCQFCQKAFTRRDNLVTHMQIYKNERPYKCGVCERAFVRKGDMMQHMNTHTNEKPYSCDICKKTFTRRADLSRHKRTMHKFEEMPSFVDLSAPPGDDYNRILPSGEVMRPFVEDTKPCDYQNSPGLENTDQKILSSSGGEDNRIIVSVFADDVTTPFMVDAELLEDQDQNDRIVSDDAPSSGEDNTLFVKDVTSDEKMSLSEDTQQKIKEMSPSVEITPCAQPSGEVNIAFRADAISHDVQKASILKGTEPSNSQPANLPEVFSNQSKGGDDLPSVKNNTKSEESCSSAHSCIENGGKDEPVFSIDDGSPLTGCETEMKVDFPLVGNSSPTTDSKIG